MAGPQDPQKSAKTNAAMDDGLFVRRVLILLGILATVSLVFLLREILLLIFGSIVLAVLLSAMARALSRWLKLKYGWALTLAVLLAVAVVGGAGSLFGMQAARQAEQIGEQIPAAWEAVRSEARAIGLDLPELPGSYGNGPGSPDTDPQDDAGETSNNTNAEDAGAEDPGAEDPGSDDGGVLGSGALATGDTVGADNDGGGIGIGGLSQDMLGRAGTVLMTTFSVLANTLLVVAGGIYLAAQPQLYRGGLIKLFTPGKRDLAETALDDCGQALKLWLLGTLFSMGLIGLVITLGLWILGVPSWLALGLLAGLLEFVPIVGPIAGAVPAVLIAFTVSPQLALMTAGLFLLVQQLEGNVIQPLVQRYAVDLPPAMLLFSIVAGGTLFGFVGILFAAPITVTAFVLVKRLYVREALDTETQLPHE